MTSVPYAEVIGDPIAHSKSPLIHRFWLEKLGIQGDYRAVQVGSGRLGDYLAQRSADPLWRGCSVTMPLKREALAHAEGLNLGGHVLPANLLWPADGGLKAHNTDVLGITEALGGVAKPLNDIVIVGAGAAAETALLTVSDWQNPVTIVARDPVKARRELGELARLARFLGWEDPWPATRLLINASPLGMSGYPAFPFALDPLEPDAAVFDMVYAPLETDLLRKARARGLVAIDGLRMLVGQARSAFQLFFGQHPPAAHDQPLRERLGA